MLTLKRNVNYKQIIPAFEALDAGANLETALNTLSQLNLDVWNLVRNDILEELGNWVTEEPKKPADFITFIPILFLFKNFIQHGIYSNVNSPDVYEEDKGLSQQQFQILKPYLITIGFYSNDAFIVRDFFKGKTELSKTEQLYTRTTFEYLVFILDAFVESFDTNEWKNRVQEAMDIVIDKSAALKKLFESKDEPKEAEPKNITKERTVLSNTRYIIITDAIDQIDKWLSTNVEFKGNVWVETAKDKILYPLQRVIDSIQVGTQYQNDTLQKALRLSGAENVKNFAAFTVSPQRPSSGIKSTDILYFPRPGSRKPFYNEMVRNFLEGWKLLFEIIQSLFGPEDVFNQSEIDDRVSKLKNLQLTFGETIKVIKSTRDFSLPPGIEGIGLYMWGFK